MLWWTMPLRTGAGPELPDGIVNVVRGTLATLLEHSNSYVYYYHEAAWSKKGCLSCDHDKVIIS